MNQAGNRDDILRRARQYDRADLGDDGRLAYRRAHRQLQHTLHLVLAGPARRPDCRRSAAQGARAGRRHVVQLESATSASPGRTRAKAASSCLCRRATRATCRRAISSFGRPPSTSVRWRSFLVNGDPSPASTWSRSLKIYPLAEAANPPTLNFVDMSGKPFNMVAPADYRFWELLNKVVQDEPTDAIDATTLGFWARSASQGQALRADERMKKILTEAAAVGDATARAIMYRLAQAGRLLLSQTARGGSALSAATSSKRTAREAQRLFRLLLLRHRRHAGHGFQDRRRRLAIHGGVRGLQGRCPGWR